MHGKMKLRTNEVRIRRSPYTSANADYDAELKLIQAIMIYRLLADYLFSPLSQIAVAHQLQLKLSESNCKGMRNKLRIKLCANEDDITFPHCQ